MVELALSLNEILHASAGKADSFLKASHVSAQGTLISSPPVAGTLLWAKIIATSYKTCVKVKEGPQETVGKQSFRVLLVYFHFFQSHC